jgi:hypothetical protein
VVAEGENHSPQYESRRERFQLGLQSHQKSGATLVRKGFMKLAQNYLTSARTSVTLLSDFAAIIKFYRRLEFQASLKDFDFMRN